MLAFFTAIAVLSALAWLYLRHHYSYWTRLGVPQEQPKLLFGNVEDSSGSVRFLKLNERVYKRHKGSVLFAGMYFFFRKAAIVLDLDLIKRILIRDFSNFQDRGTFHNERDDPLTAHLFRMEGEPWRAMRTKLTPVFTSGKMKFMFPTVVSVASNLDHACDVLSAADAEAVVEMKDLCARFTTDVIGTCAFGIECNSLQDPDAEFRRRGRSVFEQARHSQLVQAFMLTNPDLARRLRMKFFPDKTIDFYVNAVRRTVDYRLANNIKRNDFMDLLIEMKAKDETAAARGNGVDLSQGLTLWQMVAQAFVFFVAGFDTSSTTMSFCLYELALNVDVQERLRAEIVGVLEKHDGVLTYEALSEMLYLEQVLAETLRKYPVVPHLIRKAAADYRIPNTSFVLEKGVSVIIPLHAIHHDPEIYPDPEKFDPARFEPELIKQRHTAAYLPFGEGPRNCIGMRFGKMQSKIGLIYLLKHYKFTMAEKTKVPMGITERILLLTSESGIYLHVEKLNCP